MYIQVHVHTGTCTYRYMYIQVHVHTGTCTYRYMYIQVHVHTGTCTYRYMYIQVHVHTGTCTTRYRRLYLHPGLLFCEKISCLDGVGSVGVCVDCVNQAVCHSLVDGAQEPGGWEGAKDHK